MIVARKVIAGWLVFLGLLLLFALGLGGAIVFHGFGNWLHALTRIHHQRLSFWLVVAGDFGLIVAGWFVYPRRRTPEPMGREPQADEPGVWPPAPKRG